MSILSPDAYAATVDKLMCAMRAVATFEHTTSAVTDEMLEACAAAREDTEHLRRTLLAHHGGHAHRAKLPRYAPVVRFTKDDGSLRFGDGNCYADPDTEQTFYTDPVSGRVVKEKTSEVPGGAIRFIYRNHRGETAMRTVIPIAGSLQRGTTTQYPLQWTFDAYALDREGAPLRTFVLDRVNLGESGDTGSYNPSEIP